MKILVTGSTGFIGGFLTASLLSAGHEVFALVRSGVKAALLEAKGIRTIIGDISDEKSLGGLKKHAFDAIYHCAALVEDKDLDKLYKSNVAGTDNICKLAMEIGVKRLIYLSSVATVSGNEQVPLTEDLPYRATNLYGLSKLEAESLVLEHRRHGLPVVIMRPAMVYGEGEPHALDTIMRLLRFRLLPVIDGGRHKMHLVYVKNVVDALMLALTDDRFLQGSFFVADNEVLTQREVFSILSKSAFGKEPVILPSWLTKFLVLVPFAGRKIKAFLKDRVYDTSRLKALGFSPKYTTHEALRISAESWIQKMGPGTTKS